ncbi:MAG: hypothetical protein AAB263_14680 [Planctomycetota bacterium]
MFTKTRKLPWPMSRIDRDVLHELWQAGQATGKPITEIVADAVVAHLNQQLAASARAAEPSQGYHGQPQEAA